MILTYKVKHNQDLSEELKKARRVAEYAIANRDKLSTKYVKHLGLKSQISGGILRKYGRNRKCRTIKSVKLIVNGVWVRSKDGNTYIPCMKLSIAYSTTQEIRQIELDNVYAYISVRINEPNLIVPKTSLGIDLNTTGHCLVAACSETGKVYKLGKKSYHTHRKYLAIRKALQKKGKLRKAQSIKDRESRIVRDLNHKISRAIIDKATENNSEIKLENLKGIRNNRKQNKKLKYALNSWSFYQLRQFIEYKAKLAGIPVTLVDPAYTSQTCSRCGLLGTRTSKLFKCSCGHVENADSNAAFNIAKLSALKPSISRLA